MYDSQLLSETIRKLCPSPPIRAKRIRRSDGKHLEEFHFDAETAEYLGEKNLGVLVENIGKVERVWNKLQQLNQTANEGVWVVVCDDKSILRLIYGWWCDEEGIDCSRIKKLPSYWSNLKIHFAVPESLDQAHKEINQHNLLITGIIVLDWDCKIYKARGYEGMENDRPQLIVNFRAAANINGWVPPLFLMVDRAAISVDIEAVRIAFALEEFWYLDGRTLSCKPL